MPRIPPPPCSRRPPRGPGASARPPRSVACRQLWSSGRQKFGGTPLAVRQTDGHKQWVAEGRSGRPPPGGRGGAAHFIIVVGWGCGRGGSGWRSRPGSSRCSPAGRCLRCRHEGASPRGAAAAAVPSVPPPRLFVYQPFRTPPPTEPLHHRPSQSLMVFVCTPPSAPRPACAVHHHWVALAWWRSAPGPHGRTARVAARVFPAVRRGAPAVAGGLLPRLPRLPSGPAQVFATTHLGVAAALAGVGDAGFADAVLVLFPLHGSLLESDGVARV